MSDRRSMNIVVYCGAKGGSKSIYVEKARELGEWMADNGHTLVYGAGDAGMMGAVSDPLVKKGGESIGVTPDFFVLEEVTRDDLTERIVTEGMSDRRLKMMELGDAFIALPGGTGTLDEISEVIALKRLGRFGEKDRPIMLYNVEGFYDNLLRFFDDILANEFCRPENRADILEVRNIEEIAEVLNAAG